MFGVLYSVENPIPCRGGGGGGGEREREREIHRVSDVVFDIFCASMSKVIEHVTGSRLAFLLVFLSVSWSMFLPMVNFSR